MQLQHKNGLSHSRSHAVYHPTDTIIEQPAEPILAPVGTQVELTCRVAMGYRTVWILEIPGIGTVDTEAPATIISLSLRGIQAEISSEENRDIPLTINGTMENNQTTVQCRAVDTDNNQRVR